ncbi:MAG: hypothetical protein M1840_006988 [Geoglossum simile]|nr:MAG: hypothetical protein M1840_006988 [Geoglossum simile]
METRVTVTLKDGDEEDEVAVMGTTDSGGVEVVTGNADNGSDAFEAKNDEDCVAGTEGDEDVVAFGNKNKDSVSPWTEDEDAAAFGTKDKVVFGNKDSVAPGTGEDDVFGNIKDEDTVSPKTEEDSVASEDDGTAFVMEDDVVFETKNDDSVVVHFWVPETTVERQLIVPY